MDVIELTKELIDIPSDSKRDGEVEVARRVVEYLEGIGLEPELIRFNSNNADVVLSIGSGEGLMLNGHMDTVPVGDPSLWTNGISAKVTEGKGVWQGSVRHERWDCMYARSPDELRHCKQQGQAQTSGSFCGRRRD
jgi:Acetylornithine deacetylase/Succinyl-diaminopimelate desuccinylase and related deacylases